MMTPTVTSPSVTPVRSPKIFKSMGLVMYRLSGFDGILVILMFDTRYHYYAPASGQGRFVLIEVVHGRVLGI